MCFCRVYHVHAVFAPLTVSWEGAVLGLRSVFRQARKQCTFVLRRSIELEVEVFIDTVLHLGLCNTPLFEGRAIVTRQNTP